MGGNKDRLYVGLYPTGTDTTRFHWALLVGPKAEAGKDTFGTRYHVKNSLQTWEYEKVKLQDIKSTPNLLVRVLIAKIEDKKRLVKILRETPVIQGDSNWTCRSWVSSAVSRIAKDGKAVGTAELDWEKIERKAKKYAAKKIKAGRYGQGQDMTLPKPTWDMLEGKETVREFPELARYTHLSP